MAIMNMTLQDKFAIILQKVARSLMHIKY